MSEFTQHESIVAVRGIFKRASVLFTVFVVSFSIVVLIGIFVLNSSPTDFPIGSDVSIEEGMTIEEIGVALSDAGIIRSTVLFQFLIKSSHRDIVIQAGSYRFETPYTTKEVIEVLNSGISRSPAVTLTFPEGFSVYDIREYTEDSFEALSLETLIPHEGYLFPDTYFVAKTETIDDLILRMRQEYDKKLEPYRNQIAQSEFSEEEVIILASILEREANDVESMRLVSGILQNRLRDDLPLQVDATFEYVLGKTSAELTLDDLAMDSPYNTYTRLGLPPTPISNPGIMAIEAVIDPAESDYYYYLTDDTGVFHYARTFEEHKQNKERYLQ